MPNDPGLTDSCIFLNDGSPWWLSPDIELTGPISGPDRADPNPNDNAVGITVRRKSECPLSEEVGVILVDVHVCDPSVAITPASSTKITNATSRPDVFVLPSALPSGGSKMATFDWRIPIPPGANENPGHKCLIARVYPDDNTPSPTNFYCPDDPHVAQRNICIVPCEPGDSAEGGGDGGDRASARAARGKPCSFEVQTTNVNEEEAEAVTLVAEADLDPSKEVLDVVLPLLRETPGIQFNRLAPIPPQGFGMRLPDFPDAVVRDNTRPGCLYGLLRLLGVKFEPRFEAEIKLDVEQVTRFSFIPDLSTSQPGDAHIFHLTQVGSEQVVQGGLTLVFVIV